LNVYLTFNDYASGVYAGQVVDVINFLRKEKGYNIKLIAFISLRNFFKERRAIKKMDSGAWILPMFPGVKNWKQNSLSLRIAFWFIKPKVVICRGIFSTNLALLIKSKNSKIVFDARGAYYPEFSEYISGESNPFVEKIKEVEQIAIKNADKALSVSNALVGYWKTFYGYDASKKTCVIPCTVKMTNWIDDEKREKKRSELGFLSDDIVLVYSGSVSGWQSLSGLFDFVGNVFESNGKVRLLFLAQYDPTLHSRLQAYSSRIVQKWLAPEDLQAYLSCADYGLLLREPSITNSVASPTKFAEYLSVGCNVLISEFIGDFSSFVQTHKCGCLVDKEVPVLHVLTSEERKRNANLAIEYFNKEKYSASYKYLLD
jgi:hypothetical protein